MRLRSLRNLICDSSGLCPWRVAAAHGIIVVSFALGAQAWRREIGMWDYLGFSLSVVILSGAPLSKTVLDYIGPRLSGMVAPPAAPPETTKGATP